MGAVRWTRMMESGWLTGCAAIRTDPVQPRIGCLDPLIIPFRPVPPHPVSRPGYSARPYPRRNGTVTKIFEICRPNAKQFSMWVPETACSTPLRPADSAMATTNNQTSVKTAAISSGKTSQRIAPLIAAAPVANARITAAVRNFGPSSRPISSRA